MQSSRDRSLQTTFVIVYEVSSSSFRAIYWRTISQFFQLQFRHEELGLLKILLAPISLKTSMELFRAPPPKKKLLCRFKVTCWALHRLVEFVKERGIWVIMTQKVFWGLLNSFMEVLVILVRIRFFNSPNSSCLNYYQKKYGLYVYKRFLLVETK